jgi:DNA-binding NtrC family response regulator
MRCVRPVLPWWRAVLVAEPAWECRADAAEPTTPAPGDLAQTLAARCAGPVVHDLLRDSALRGHETRGLHALGAALLAPAAPGAVLYVDFREGLSLPGDRELAFLACLARVLGPHLPAPEPRVEQTLAPFPGILGRCDAMDALFRALAAVAPSEVTVHVYGETGTGKEKVARALHERSRRAAFPFVAINASSYGDELFQAELFGHRRGAFTGADRDREGLVAAAEGGTLFIDEVTDLSPNAQARLLRLVQERTYRRAGENEERKANVRIVTASNARLEDRVAARAFRMDLMYRLNVETLRLPPVRERGDDVLILARHFLTQAARRERVPVPALSCEAARALLAYHWPGNVREVDNEMQRAVLRAGRGPVRIEHLSKELKAPPPRPRSSLREALRDFERAYVRDALAKNGGNRARTALELGLTRQALVAKIPKLGL